MSTSGKVSRAEAILQAIESLTERAGVSLSDLDAIAVSIGPGSFTGIRIGIATAIGLKKALSIDCIGVSALEAMAYSVNNQVRIIAVLPTGRNLFAAQHFDLGVDEGHAVGSAEILDAEELARRFADPGESHFVVHPDVIANDNLAAAGGSMDHLTVCQNDIATLIGKRALAGGGQCELVPLYLRPRERASSSC